MRGHIQPYGQGWRVHVNLGRDGDGRRRSKTQVVHGTRDEAERVLTRFLHEVDEGHHRATPGSVEDLAQRWWDAESPGWSANTRSTQGSIKDNHLLPALGTKQVRKVTPADLDRLYGKLATAGLGPATIRRVHAVARSMFAKAVRWGELNDNPALKADPPRVPAEEVRAPSREDVRALIAEAKRRDPDLACFLRLAGATGCRRAELCALRWEDIDLERGEVAIAKAVSAAGPADGKTKQMKSGRKRRISLDPGTVGYLAAHHVEMVRRAEKCGARPGPWVFSADEAGRRPWHPSSVTHRFARVAKATGVDAHLHSLRHFAATQMLYANVPLHDVAHKLGHARTSTTSDIYGAFIPGRDQAAADAMGDALGD